MARRMQGEIREDFMECMDRGMVIFRYHFARMWKDRQDPNTRHAIRDNIRGQRSIKVSKSRES